MKHAIDIAEQVPGTYWHAAAILKLEADAIIGAPLEELRFEIGGGAITRRVDADVGPLRSGPASLRVPLHWQAAEHPTLFPVMDAVLRVSDRDGNQVAVELLGEYRSPFGAVGALADAVAGRRVAEKALHGFLADVAHRLETRLVEHTRRAGVEP